jgi:hypothetical protein
MPAETITQAVVGRFIDAGASAGGRAGSRFDPAFDV